MANKYRAWVDGEVVTAANLIDYVQKQVLIVCDSSADYPDSSTRREGMAVYDKALDCELVFDGTSWVRIMAVTTTGVQTWTPTLTQSGTVTHTATEARYVRNGCVVQAWGYLSVTGSGTSNNSVTVSLPVTASGNAVGSTVGSVMILASSTVYTGVAQVASSTTISFRVAASGGTNSFGGSPSVALANGDSIRFIITYTV
jgi:hypothetical protein